MKDINKLNEHKMNSNSNLIIKESSSEKNIFSSQIKVNDLEEIEVDLYQNDNLVKINSNYQYTDKRNTNINSDEYEGLRRHSNLKQYKTNNVHNENPVSKHEQNLKLELDLEDENENEEEYPNHKYGYRNPPDQSDREKKLELPLDD